MVNMVNIDDSALKALKLFEDYDYKITEMEGRFPIDYKIAHYDDSYEELLEELYDFDFDWSEDPVLYYKVGDVVKGIAIKNIAFGEGDGYIHDGPNVNEPISNGSFNHIEILYLEACFSLNPSDLFCQLLSLKNLRLSIYDIQKVSSTICNLQSLEHLELNDCRIKTLPESIGDLKNLKYLNLDNNRIDSLPNSLKKFKILEVFSMELSEKNRKIYKMIFCLKFEFFLIDKKYED